MQFNTCLIADLFCGSGKNGDKDGSPLVLINKAKYILSSHNFNNKYVQILFNDQDENHIRNLKDELKKMKIENNIKIKPIINKKFENLLPQIIKQYENINVPKFFFLDPFTYSDVKITHLKQLMELAHTEVLLFLPLFYSYRFANDLGMPENHKTRLFIEEFTTKGISNYKDVDAFMDSVREKLLIELSLEFVRPVLLDGGGSKNTLFLFTKHREGMLLMNKIATKMTDDGSRVDVKNPNQLLLFKKEEFSKKYTNYKKKLENLLMIEHLTNKEIVLITIREGFLPKQGKKVLENIYRQNKIKVYNKSGKEIKNGRGWNIAEKITKTIYFKWNSNYENKN